MTHIPAFTLLAVVSMAAVSAQQAAAPQPSPPKEAPNHQAEFFKSATNGSIFIYSTQVDPCGPVPDGRMLLPLGSGFVTGIEKTGASTPSSWVGWKFLVTAKHVLAAQGEITIRVNADHESKFVCKKITLHTDGPTQNAISAPPGVDLEAVAMPDIPGADPTVVPASLLIDQGKMLSLRVQRSESEFSGG
jgi:hypothetical protein